MNPKLSFFLGVALGGAAVAAWSLSQAQHPSTSPPPEAAANEPAAAQPPAPNAALEAARARISKLESDNQALAKRVQENMKRAETAEASARSGPSGQGTDGGATNAMVALMQNAMKEQLRHQTETKVRQMKERLNLTPDQETRIHEILDRANTRAAEVAMKAMNGGGITPDDADPSKNGVDSESEIRALLTPEQLQAYGAMKTEENQANARIMANSELLQMQSSLGLTQDQQDKVFNVLYAQTLDMMGGSNQIGAGGDFSSYFSRRTDSLRGILTDAQLEEYQKTQQQQLQMIQAFTGAAKPGDGSGAASIHVFTAPAPPQPVKP